MRIAVRIVLVIGVCAAQLLAPSIAEAHERRSVGPYQLVVGFLSEPAIAGQPNGVDLRVTDTRADPPRDVEGLQDTVKVEVFYGGLSSSFAGPLRARFGMPGAYAADFIPTRAGAYRFVFSGKIEDSDLNETFESGPGRFDDVEASAELQYPAKVPTGADLADRLDDIDRKLGSLQALAIVALALAVVLPLGLAAAARRSRR